MAGSLLCIVFGMLADNLCGCVHCVCMIIHHCSHMCWYLPEWACTGTKQGVRRLCGRLIHNKYIQTFLNSLVGHLA